MADVLVVISYEEQVVVMSCGLLLNGRASMSGARDRWTAGMQRLS